MREIHLLPKKHISLELSLIGFGAQLIRLLDSDMSSDELWDKYIEQDDDVVHSYDEFVLTLDFLYMIGGIYMKDGGRLCLS